MSASALNVLHLADSAFPAGGFAFSSGVEAAAKLGLFTCRSEFAEFLRSALHQVVGYEIAFLNDCFRDTDAVELREAYHSGFTAPSLLRASLAQGRGYIRAMNGIVGADAYPQTLSRLPPSPDRRHFLLVFGWSLAEMGVDVAEARSCFLYINLRDWMSAAIRLGCVGPLEAHALQHRLLLESAGALEAAASRNHRQARRRAAALDIAQSWHDRIYSKLFQS